MHKEKEKNIPAKASKEKINTWKRNRRIRAYSKVGTPDYMVKTTLRTKTLHNTTLIPPLQQN